MISWTCYFKKLVKPLSDIAPALTFSFLVLNKSNTHMYFPLYEKPEAISMESEKKKVTHQGKRSTPAKQGLLGKC